MASAGGVWFHKVSLQRADHFREALVFAGTLGLSVVGEDHFADGFAPRNRGIEDGHGELLFPGQRKNN
jgi:hypothetical protein